MSKNFRTDVTETIWWKCKNSPDLTLNTTITKVMSNTLEKYTIRLSNEEIEKVNEIIYLGKLV